MVHSCVPSGEAVKLVCGSLWRDLWKDFRKDRETKINQNRTIPKRIQISATPSIGSSRVWRRSPVVTDRHLIGSGRAHTMRLWAGDCGTLIVAAQKRTIQKERKWDQWKSTIGDKPRLVLISFASFSSKFQKKKFNRENDSKWSLLLVHFK